MFAALFFVSVGALMNITLLPLFIIPALALVAVSIAAKFLTVFLSARYQGLNTVVSLRTSFGLSSSGGELALSRFSIPSYDRVITFLLLVIRILFYGMMLEIS
jgi:Kef-type K+ transport system membrane component KefB